MGRPPPPVDSAERVAGAIVGLADRPRPSVSVGATNRLIQFGFVALPPVYDALVTTMMRNVGLSRQATAPHDGNVFGPRPVTEGGPGRWTRSQVATAALVTGGAVTAVALLARRMGRAAWSRPARWP